MDLNGRNAHRLQSVQKGIGVVGERAGVDDDGVVYPLGGVDPVDERSLVVGLEEVRRAGVGCGKSDREAHSVS